MKSSSTGFPQRLRSHDNNKRERCHNVGKLTSFLFTSVAIIAGSTLFALYYYHSPNPFKLIPKQGLISPSLVQQQHQQQSHKKNLHAIQDKTSLNSHHTMKKCDVFRGHWVRELRGVSLYSNSSCVTIPESKNCFASGRRDMDFLNWKWKPDNCDLPSFNAKAFLEMVRGKKMAFVGDSVARNHFESLLCLLSPEETPVDVYKDSEDRFRTWYFRRYDFTLMILWTKFLVEGSERMVNGTGSSAFDLFLDKVDNSWSRSLPELDFVVLSSGHWFFRVMYLNEREKLTGCVYCPEQNVTKRDVGFAVRMAFRAALSHIVHCKGCKAGLVALVRTFAPAHFEGGAWNTGGHCNRTGPLGEASVDSFDWEMRNIQVEEVKRARKMGARLGVVDVTRAMLMRPDGHPGTHWANKWMKGYSDCVHWCMPGPIDYWSDFLLDILRQESGLI